ncbi:MAG: putative bifunctional diguanylate cyclase/phosphodiesterase [Acidimicrobiia bacterium]
MTVVHEDKLSAVLSEFARTLATDFPIQGILDHLVGRIVEVLPIKAAGVTLISAGSAPRYIAASDGSALRFERLQTEIREGPCLDAFDSGKAVAVPDLRTDARYARFGPAALEAGLAAVFTFPLRHGDGRLGALDLYCDTPGKLEPHDMGVAQTLADVAAAYLLNAQARDEVRATADRFHHIALHDPLTGLPNRLLLQQRLEHAAQRARRSNTNAAILFADLDRFKQVNDTYGHHVGDELLLAVAHRLTGLVRPGDTLARVSGDEFVFLCEDLSSAEDVEILAKRIDRAFAAPFVLPDVEIMITASVGMAYAGPGEEISDQLVDKADTAMYQAKRKGGAGHQIIDLREALRDDDRNSLEHDLRSAMADDQLALAYQPIVRSRDGLVTGVEALLRWTHPERGLVPTMQMVGIAEQTELICEIGAWVLERSCRDRARWLHEHPHAPLDLAVNVSTRQLMDPDICSMVTRAMDETDMDPGALVLEMTENIFIEDSQRALTVLADLSQLGIRLALDDFGTGYSSLSYLLRLPVHMVKIDQGFIADIGSAPAGAAIVAAVTNLAHVLGLSVIAEGVETQRQRDEVSAIGCEAAQGYFYARPMPAEEISSYLGAVPTTPLRLPQPARAAAAS